MASPPPISKAPFPAPPPFWREFTAENNMKLEAIKREVKGDLPSTKSVWKPSELRALELPTDLRHLVPPAPPTETSYKVFGQPQPVIPSLPSLASLGVTQLFPDSRPSTPSQSPITYLLLFTKSLLLNFNEFTSILASNPSEAQDKLEDIKTLFLNAHHLINKYRPHQARETLILMMEDQIREANKEIEECDRVVVNIKNLLGELEKEGQEAKEGELGLAKKHSVHNASEEKEVRELWDMINQKNGGT